MLKFIASHAHLIIRGFVADYRCWNKHGEEGFNDHDLHAGCMDPEFSGSHTGRLPRIHVSQDGEEGPFDSHDLSDGDLENIGANYVHMVENLEEMVRDAMGFDEYTNAELKKLKRLVTNMRTPTLSELQG